MARVDQIKRLLESEPDDVSLNFSLAMEYQSAGQTEEALRQFDRTLELDANYLAAYVRKGKLLLAEHRFEEARSTYDRGIEVARAANDQHMVSNITEMRDQIP